MDALASAVPDGLRARSGRVFYAGRAAWEAGRPVYLLGVNPGGRGTGRGEGTVAEDIADRLAGPPRWSAYLDDPWLGTAPGRRPLQRRMAHLFARLGLDLRLTPASNLIFVRSAREACLKGEFRALAEACWGFHARAIAAIRPRLVLCFGARAGAFVRQRTGARREIGRHREENARGWPSRVFEAPSGLRVACLTHPSIVDWTGPRSDPGALVASALAPAP